MTTEVIIKANHGWPVDVTAYDPRQDESEGVLVLRVPAGQTHSVHVHSSRDLLIHEVQPEELEKEAAETAKTAAPEGETESRAAE